MAEWLRSGLQIRARRFDSGSGLQISVYAIGVRSPFAALAAGDHPELVTRIRPVRRCVCLHASGRLRQLLPETGQWPAPSRISRRKQPQLSGQMSTLWRLLRQDLHRERRQSPGSRSRSRAPDCRECRAGRQPGMPPPAGRKPEPQNYGDELRWTNYGDRCNNPLILCFPTSPTHAILRQSGPTPTLFDS